MAKRNVAAAIEAIIVEVIGTDESSLKPEARLVDDLGCDSLDCVELVMAAEEEFNIEISDEDAEKLVTVQDCIDHVEKILKRTQGA